MQLRRGDKAVLSISAGLAAIVVAAVAFGLLVVDRSPPPSKQPGNSSSSLLVMTWGPSLCRVERNNSGCRSGHVEKLGRTLILHGLWPQPPTEQFCDVPTADEGRARDHLRDTDIASLDLPQDVQSKLQSMMSDIKAMVPHEWYAHGSCSGVTPAVYFSDAVTLADQLGRMLDPVFEKAQGRQLSLGTIRERIAAELGDGAGERVSLTCRDVDKKEIVVYEVQLSLPPVAELGATQSTLSLQDLLFKGPTISAQCRRGRVP